MRILLAALAFLVWNGGALASQRAGFVRDDLLGSILDDPFEGMGVDPFGTYFGFVEVEPGEFTMGSPESERDRYDDEVPHKVVITRPYQIAQYEVTQVLWKKIMHFNPSLEKHPRLPVTDVSWDDTRDFLAQLNVARAADGYTYRLPTEAEWEYAVRGGNKLPPEMRQGAYPGGATTGDLNQFAWSYDPRTSGTGVVGRRGPDVLGLYDMKGNAWEWVEDKYVKDASKIPVSAKYGHPVNLTEGTDRVARAGGWSARPRDLRSAARYFMSPTGTNGHLGLRLVRVRN